MAVWIDEHGTLVRNAESASIERSPLRDMDIPDGLPERMAQMLTEVKAIPDDAAAYRAAIVDWVERGAESPYVLSPDEVIARSRPRGAQEAEAAASFELGRHLRATVGEEAAVPWWRRAHELDPGNWTYKRQAWTLVTTAPDATENDLIQGPNDVYAGNWLDDVVTAGGGEHYGTRPRALIPLVVAPRSGVAVSWRRGRTERVSCGRSLWIRTLRNRVTASAPSGATASSLLVNGARPLAGGADHLERPDVGVRLHGVERRRRCGLVGVAGTRRAVERVGRR